MEQQAADFWYPCQEHSSLKKDDLIVLALWHWLTQINLLFKQHFWTIVECKRVFFYILE